MMKRSLFLIAALGLLASLALVAPSQAGVMYTYTVAPTSPQTIMATSVGTGSASITFTASPGGSATAPTAPAAGDAYISVTTYTQTAMGNGITFIPPSTVIANGGSYTNQTESQVVTVTYGGKTGTFTVTETMNGFAYAGALITPQISTSGPQLIDGVYFTVYQQGTAFNVNTQKSYVQIGIESISVPEPTSMALLGIGMTSFLAFRRFFKRNTVV